ncbi:MAG: hypothetical protein WC712_02205 [Candidatus Brocadiia bacterium]
MAEFFPWILILVGIVLGMVIGLKSHEENWAGGYSSYRRRMLRLAHISAIALGAILALYSLVMGYMPGGLPEAGFIFLLAGGILMPITCLLTAWKEKFRHFFAVPALCVATAVGIMAWLKFWVVFG